MSLHMMEAKDGRKIGPAYLVRDGEMLLNAPVREAWPHVINYPIWQNYSSVQRISGQPGAEGEVVLLKKEEKGFEFPPYYAITLKLEPEKLVIWKTYIEKGTQEIDLSGIVEFHVKEIGGKTRFRYHVIYEFLVPYRNESELTVFRDQQGKNFEALFAAVLPKLKKLVDGESEN